MPRDLECLAPYLEEINWKLLYRPETETTMSLPEDTPWQGDSNVLFVTDYQSDGRGRRGRGWFSPPGKDITMSLFLPIEGGGVDTLHMLNASLSGVKSLRDLCTEMGMDEDTSQDIWPKWPNDIYWHEKKAGGVLGEFRKTGSGRYMLVIGVGLNLNSSIEDVPPELQNIMTGFFMETGLETNRGRAIIYFIRHFLKGLEAIKTSPSLIIREWEAMSRMTGREVVVRTERGVIEGVVLGIDKNGFLLLNSKRDGIIKVSSGDVEKIRFARR